MMLLKEFLKKWSHQVPGQGLPMNKCLRRYQAQTIRFNRYFVSNSHDESPYAILNVKGNASKEEIKTAFRNLAKQHHPDLNRRVFDEENDNTMAKLVNAYETLMSKYSSTYLSDATDSRVALACEIYTVDELRDSPMFDVYSFRINFNDCDHDGSIANGGDSHKDMELIHAQNSSSGQTKLDANPILPIDVHPQDSISDLKRSIQNKYASVWGLEDRKRDRDGLYLGWELIYRRVDSEDNESFGESANSHSVLSYHLFLDSYGIRDGDNLYAIVKSR